MKMDMNVYANQNELLLNNLISYYSDHDYQQLDKILPILNGNSSISLRIIDWFVTNYAKQHYVVYTLSNSRFKVYNDYKLKLKAYSKKRFDPFCRWEKNVIPYRTNQFIQTTIGQLNFFKWVLDNEILDYIQANYELIEQDMALRNMSKPKTEKNRKKREELSVFASKTIKKEVIEISISFN
jgi:RecG-like helicase